MTRRSLAPWLPWLLGTLTLLALASNAPQRPVTLHVDPRISIIMIALVGFVVNVEVPLVGDAISLGYAAGLMIYLILGRNDGVYEAFGVIAIGATVGGALRAWWSAREAGGGFRAFRHLIESPLMSVSQLTLSMIAGGAVYRALGGTLPLTALHTTDAIPLAGLVVVSVAVYLVLYGLVVLWHLLSPADVFVRNILAIALAILVPIPLVIGAALLYTPSFGGFVMLIAGLLGMAIGATELGRAHLRYRQQVVELQSLSAVNSAMRTHLDLDVLIETIHLQVATLLEAPDMTLALYETSRNLLTFPLVMSHGQRMNVPPRELGMELVDHVIATKAPLLLAENPARLAAAMNLVPPAGHLTSWLGVPLMAPDRALGCLAIALDDPYRRFTVRDQRLLAAVATQSSVAIENAQLYRQVQERARQLTRLNNLAAQLSGTLDPKEVLDAVAQATITVAEAASAAVFLWHDGKSMRLAESTGLSEQFTDDPPVPLSMTASRTANPSSGTQPLVIQNARLDPRAAGIYDLMRREKINAWIELPLHHGDESLGVLVAYFEGPHSFTGDEIELLRAFANQAALSISNARLYHQTDEALDRRIKQLSALASINKELSSTLNLNNVFRLVLDRAIEATRSNNGVLLLRNERQDEPRRVASRGVAKLRTTELMDMDAVSQAYATGQPVVDRGQDGDVLARLCVPLVRDFDVLGVMVLESKFADAYPQDDISFVSQLATLATIAIDNARVFEWMQDSHNRLQVILDSTHEAVLLFDLNGRVLLANPRVALLLGLDPTLIVGERLDTLLSRMELMIAKRLGFNDNQQIRDLFGELNSATWQAIGRLSYRLDQPQTRFIDRTIVPVFDQNRKIMGILMVFLDATEERQLAQTREDLSRMIVHDLRSPLTAINASMKLLTEMVPDDAVLGLSIRRTTDVSQRALRKLLNLVDSLLDIAKMESGNITLDIGQHDLRPLVESVRSELSPLAEELNIQVEIVIPEDLPPLAIDVNKIERVLLNLVDNALKFAPVDGLIRVAACRDSNKQIRVDVADNGPGIPDEYKVRIFERFQQIDQAKAHRRGTGLGLTFCRLTIEAHGGQIWIEDNPDGGSVFAFTLPMVVE